MYTLQFSIQNLESKIKPDSVRAYQKYNVSRYELINFLTKERSFNYSKREALDHFYLETSNLNFVQNLAVNSPTQIVCEDIYNVIWKTPRGRILKETDTSKQYFISYRKAKPEYKLPAYVMIWEKVY